jgi:redox-sensitive bicupin YhaK (pirin superfamily)
MIELVIERRRRGLGGGMEVGRVLPFAKRHMVGPYIFFDHMGPLDLAPGLDRSVDARRLGPHAPELTPLRDEPNKYRLVDYL